MDTVPEISCPDCNQQIPIDRDACPYCRHPVKSYWFEDQGNIKRAAPFSENGKDCMFIDGKKLSRDNVKEISYAFKLMMDIKDRQPKDKIYRVAKIASYLLLGWTPLVWIVLLIMGPPSNEEFGLPSKWDTWLDKS